MTLSLSIRLDSKKINTSFSSPSDDVIDGRPLSKVKSVFEGKLENFSKESPAFFQGKKWALQGEHVKKSFC